MPRITLDMQEGFRGEPITIRIDGTAVYEGKPKTRNQIGFAESTFGEFPGPSHQIEVSNSISGQKCSARIESEQDVYLALNSQEDGAMHIRQASEPFHYL